MNVCPRTLIIHRLFYVAGFFRLCTFLFASRVSSTSNTDEFSLFCVKYSSVTWDITQFGESSKYAAVTWRISRLPRLVVEALKL